MPAKYPLPLGAQVLPIAGFPDDRGRFAEIFRSEWETGVAPLQWNLLESKAGTLRGMHVHVLHDDFLVQLRGRCLIGLKDLRRDSPTVGMATVIEVDGEVLEGVTIPHGVAHTLVHPSDSLQVLGVSHYYDKIDEQGCRWDDPDLGIPWTIEEPKLSERDRTLGTLADLQAVLEPYQPI